MTKFTYCVIATYEDTEFSLKTNDPDHAIRFLFEHTEDGAQVDVINNFTGEILLRNTPEEVHMTREWSLMLIGWMLQNNYRGFGLM
jgi:hypothetical protein